MGLIHLRGLRRISQADEDYYAANPLNDEYISVSPKQAAELFAGNKRMLRFSLSLVHEGSEAIYDGEWRIDFGEQCWRVVKSDSNATEEGNAAKQFGFRRTTTCYPICPGFQIQTQFALVEDPAVTGEGTFSGGWSSSDVSGDCPGREVEIPPSCVFEDGDGATFSGALEPTAAGVASIHFALQKRSTGLFLRCTQFQLSLGLTPEANPDGNGRGGTIFVTIGTGVFYHYPDGNEEVMPPTGYVNMAGVEIPYYAMDLSIVDNWSVETGLSEGDVKGCAGGGPPDYAESGAANGVAINYQTTLGPLVSTLTAV